MVVLEGVSLVLTKDSPLWAQAKEGPHVGQLSVRPQLSIGLVSCQLVPLHQPRDGHNSTSSFPAVAMDVYVLVLSHLLFDKRGCLDDVMEGGGLVVRGWNVEDIEAHGPQLLHANHKLPVLAQHHVRRH